MVSGIKEMEASEKPQDMADPSGSDIDAEKKAKFARLRKFMSMNRGDRDAFLARKGKSSSEDEEDEESGEQESDPYVKSYLKGMKRDDEEEPELDELDKN
jgi:hypothetical protein